MALISKTFSSAGNRKTWTWSAWLKIIGDTSKNYTLMTQVDGWAANGNAGFYLNGESLQAYNFLSNVNAGTSSRVSTTAYLRDPNAWYHVVLRFDTTQSSASDRVRWYINGELQTDLVHANYPSQNFDANFNTAAAHGIGRHTDSNTYPYEGAMSHIHFCDGYSYAPTEFGETDSTTGIWKIKTSPSVSYGTNGFFILKDGNSVTDQSGQSNDWTVSAGTVTDLKDNPSNNYATLNHLDNYYQADTLSNVNLTMVGGGQYAHRTASIGLDTGKWYWEIQTNNFESSDQTCLGISSEVATAANYEFYNQSGNNVGYGYFSNGSGYGNGGTIFTGYGSASGTHTIGVALDLDNNKIAWSYDGTWQGSADPANGTNMISITAPSSLKTGTYFPAFTQKTNTRTLNVNFGNGYFGTTAISSAGSNGNGSLFEYDVPSGYYALNTKNINTYG